MKNIIKKSISFFLMVILCTANLSEAAFAAPFTYKNVTYFFKNLKEEDKQILKDNFYFYKTTTNEKIYPTDDIILINDTGTDAGCLYVKFDRIPLDEEMQIRNMHDMVLFSVKGENGANVHYSIFSVNLSVDGNIIDTIYTYGVGFHLPYDGTEEIFQKEDLNFYGWYNSGGEKVAEAKNGYVSIDEIPRDNTLYATWGAHAHVWDSEWSSNSLSHWHECIGQGQCDIMGNIYKDGYAEHDFSGEEVEITAPSCEEEGLTWTYCSQEGCPVYGVTEPESIGHLEENDWTYNEYNHWKKCSRENCDEKFYIEEHEMGAWITVNEPTYDAMGKEERHCNYCEYKETNELPMLEKVHEHDFTGIEEIINSESCTGKGLKRIHCIDNECLEFIEEDLEPLGHLCDEEWSQDEVNHYKSCQRCKIKQVEEIHTFGEWICKKEATVEEEGLEVQSCEACGYEKSRIIECIEEEPTTEKLEEPTTEKVEESTTEKKEESKKEEPKKEESDKNLIKVEPPYMESTPVTADHTPIKIYATLAMVAGFTYLLSVFGEGIFGMTEEQKDDIVGRLISWGKNTNWFKKRIAMMLIFIVLLYYYAIGKNIPTEVWTVLNEE